MVTKNLKRFISLFLLLFFALTSLSFTPQLASSSDARPKKKIKRVKRVKKIKRVKKGKKIKRVKKAKRSVKKNPRPAPLYKLPSRTGTITQNYSLVEGVDEVGAQNIVRDLKDLGADEAGVDVENNSLKVKFNSRELSAVGIMKKLKELGYTVNRID